MTEARPGPDPSAPGDGAEGSARACTCSSREVDEHDQVIHTVLCPAVAATLAVVAPSAYAERKVQSALRAVDAEQAYHWPTIAATLATEVRRLRAAARESTAAPTEALVDAGFEMASAHQSHQVDKYGRPNLWGCAGRSDPLTGAFCQFMGGPREHVEHRKDRLRAALAAARTTPAPEVAATKAEADHRERVAESLRMLCGSDPVRDADARVRRHMDRIFGSTDRIEAGS